MSDRRLTEPTEDERRNGWTAERLSAHLRQSAEEEERMLSRRMAGHKRQRTAVKDWNPQGRGDR